MRRHTFLIGIISTGIYLVGNILILFDQFLGGYMAVAGLVIYIFGFALSFFIDRVTIESRRLGRISLIFLFLTIAIVLISIVFKLLRLPGTSIGLPASVVIVMIYVLFFARQLEGRQLRIRMDRQLAAIMFTDIVNFSKLMGADENQTLAYLDSNRKLQKRLARKYRGKWLKEMGDGTILVFYTASEAVLCGMEIQAEIKKAFDFAARQEQLRD